MKNKHNRKILLSFDVEEFDIPIEYGQKVSEKTQLQVSQVGLKNIIKLLARLNIKATFFVTANFAIRNKELIKQISSCHEIGSHGLFHTSFESNDIKVSKYIIEKIIGKEIHGLRVPKFQKCDKKEIIAAGYHYNSSINPIYLPGKYNNFFVKRTVFCEDYITNIPISATPIIRFPLFWLSFKNFPYFIMKPLLDCTLRYDNYLNIFFHSWEFADISNYKLPFYVKRVSGNNMINKLERYLVWLKKKAEFVTFSDFVDITTEVIK